MNCCVMGGRYRDAAMSADLQVLACLVVARRLSLVSSVALAPCCSKQFSRQCSPRDVTLLPEENEQELRQRLRSKRREIPGASKVWRLIKTAEDERGRRRQRERANEIYYHRKYKTAFRAALSDIVLACELLLSQQGFEPEEGFPADGVSTRTPSLCERAFVLCARPSPSQRKL